MAKDKKGSIDALPPATSATSATNWEELNAPKSYCDAVALASKILTARLDPDPRATWKIRIHRTEEANVPRFFLQTGNAGQTRADFFARIAEGADTSLADRGMAARLHREEETRKPKGKGRPLREQAAFKNPAGQSVDAIIHQICKTLIALGWQPLSRAQDTGLQTSVFDAVADALRKNHNQPNSYSGVRNVYYSVSNKVATFK